MDKKVSGAKYQISNIIKFNIVIFAQNGFC